MHIRDHSPITCFQPNEKMEAGIRTTNLCSFAEFLANGGHQCISPSGIRNVGATEMSIEVPRADEVCKNELFQYRRSRVSHCLCRHNRFYQHFRQHKIPQPQSWKENLGERADINYAVFPV